MMAGSCRSSLKLYPKLLNIAVIYVVFFIGCYFINMGMCWLLRLPTKCVFYVETSNFNDGKNEVINCLIITTIINLYFYLIFFLFRQFFVILLIR